MHLKQAHRRRLVAVISSLCFLLANTGASGQGLEYSKDTRQLELAACNKEGKCSVLGGNVLRLLGSKFHHDWSHGGLKAACAVSTPKPGQRLCSLAAGQQKTAYFENTGALVYATSPTSYSSSNPQDTGGVKVLAPAGDQGNCQSCTAFAVVAAAQAAVAKVLKVDVRDIRLSPQDLFFCSTDPHDCTSSWTLPDTLHQLKQRQLLQADCLPYNPPDTKQLVPQQKLCKAKCQKKNTVASQGTFDMQKIADPWQAIQHMMVYGGVVSRFDIYNDFKDFFKIKSNADKVYRPDPKAKVVEYHAVFVVGYHFDDNNRNNGYWLAQNSWSATWGQGGLFKVAMGTCGVMTPTDPPFLAYGVFWTPTTAQTVEKEKLEVVQAPQRGCYIYKAVAGDYLPALSFKTEIAMPQLLEDNQNRIGDMLDAPLAGRSLLLCSPTQESIAVRQVASTTIPTSSPTSSPATGGTNCPSISGRRLLAIDAPGTFAELQAAYKRSQDWRKSYCGSTSSACAKSASSLC